MDATTTLEQLWEEARKKYGSVEAAADHELRLGVDLPTAQACVAHFEVVEWRGAKQLSEDVNRSIAEHQPSHRQVLLKYRSQLLVSEMRSELQTVINQRLNARYDHQEVGQGPVRCSFRPLPSAPRPHFVNRAVGASEFRITLELEGIPVFNCGSHSTIDAASERIRQVQVHAISEANYHLHQTGAAWSFALFDGKEEILGNSESYNNASECEEDISYFMLLVPGALIVVAD